MYRINSRTTTATALTLTENRLKLNKAELPYQLPHPAGGIVAIMSFKAVPGIDESESCCDTGGYKPSEILLKDYEVLTYSGYEADGETLIITNRAQDETTAKEWPAGSMLVQVPSITEAADARAALNKAALEAFVNGDGTLTAPNGEEIPTIKQQLENMDASNQIVINKLFEDAKISNWTIVGAFVSGATINKSTDLMVSANGDTWRYSGNTPYDVPANTVPSAPDWIQTDVSPNKARINELTGHYVVPNKQAAIALGVLPEGTIVEVTSNDGGKFKVDLASGYPDTGDNYCGMRIGIPKLIRIDDLDLKSFGLIGDGSDEAVKLQKAIDYCGVNKLALIGKDMLIGFNPPAATKQGILIVSDSNWSFINVEFKALGKSYIGAFVYSGAVGGDGRSLVLSNNVLIDGLSIDSNNIEGDNGLSIAGDNITIKNPVIRNVRQSKAVAGGKAIQSEGNISRKGITIKNPLIIDSDIGIHQQASDIDNLEGKIRGVVYTDVVMRNVGIPIAMHNTYAATEDHIGDTRKFDLFVNGLHCYNCGKVTWNNVTGTPGGAELEGAIISSDRGFGLRVDGIRVVNEDSYGEIGAIFRGSGFNIQINGVDINAPKISALFNFTPFDLLSFNRVGATARFANTLFAKSINARNTDIGLIVDDQSLSKLGNAEFDVMINSDNAPSLDMTTQGGLVSTNFNGNEHAFLFLKNKKGDSTDLIKETIGKVRLKTYDQLAYPVSMEKGSETFSNSIGTFTKFPDGRMISTQVVDINIAVNIPVGSGFIGVLGPQNFPVSFIGPLPVVTAFLESSTFRISLGAGVANSAPTLAKTQSINLFSFVAANSTAYKIHIVSHGFWKVI